MYAHSLVSGRIASGDMHAYSINWYGEIFVALKELFYT